MDVTPLRRFVESVPGDVLVVSHRSLWDVAEALGSGCVLRDLGAELDQDLRRWPAVLLLVPDALALRRAASSGSTSARSKNLGCWVAESEHPLVPGHRPEWPRLTSMTTRLLKVGGTLTSLRLTTPVSAGAVFEELARSCGAVAGGQQGVVVGTADGAVPMGPGMVRLSRAGDACDPELTVPPDVVVHADALAAGLTPHPVIDRAPTVVDPDSFGLRPIDEGVLNPTGYLQPADGDLLTLRSTGRSLRLLGDGAIQEAAHERGATPAMVRLARPHRGVQVEWSEEAARPLAAAVAGLAAAGVPLVGETPDGARALLGNELCAVLDDPVDLDDHLHREEHSVRLRRAALLAHNTRAWRGRLAKEAGVAFRRFPTVSILLATRRPEMVGHALRQVAKQRGADLDVELVLVTHGFSVGIDAVREQVPGRVVHVHDMPQDAFFGDVLNAALDRASGDLVVKMDDDDWYGPDFLIDLLLAREYSGADVLGVTGEYVYLEPLDRTIRRTDDSERAAKFVAGGSMLLGRSFLRELGGFRRVRKYVDAQLLAAVHAMGGHVYRGHGLGYMLRRNSTGHTWDPGLDYYLAEKRLAQQWEGFVPSRILEFDEVDRPQPRVERDG